MDYNYLVPANSKKQNLILGIFTKLDLLIVIIGATISFIFLLTIGAAKAWQLIVSILPLAVAAFLVFPMPNYHNVRVFFREMYRFYFINRRKYVWRGWCYKYEQSDEFKPNEQSSKSIW